MKKTNNKSSSNASSNKFSPPAKPLSAKEISRRETLLLAQAELGKAQEALDAGEEKMAKLHFEIYQKCKAFLKPKRRARK